MSEASKRPVETPAEWLQFADENLFVAARALSFEDPTYHTVCFLCQSAAEKYLKGYLIGKGWTLEKTHDIVVLLGLCSDYDPSFAEILLDAAVLNEYIVSGRYPGDLSFEMIGREEAEEAVAIVERIREMVSTGKEQKTHWED
ncbi:MAG: HEPN domain-containing protein [Caldilineales bacterium]|nr:HEPN domain-containing protein [Caldilineales bacterium]MCW5858562.1 HEPN domain-containing protein [Caldilineales bacterium]